jgi:chromosome partitioning protein
MTVAQSASRSTHIVVVGNEKGGSGKSTTAMHLAVALLQSGLRVATIDLDSRQRTLSRYVANRERWVQSHGLDLPLPSHRLVERCRGDSVRGNAWAEYEAFAQTLGAMETGHDVVVIDTPGADTALARIGHGAADTIVTPINDSLVDLDVLAEIDPTTATVRGLSHYAHMVAEARRERRLVDNGVPEWVIVRNRLTPFESRNRRIVTHVLGELGPRAGFRVAPGISERVIFREFFAMGLTALDPLEATTLGLKPTMSHIAARQEVRALIDALRLPVDERGRRRASARAIWNDAAAQPLDIGDFVDAR